MAEKSTLNLLNDITVRLADNNAGDISAGDVRENMYNIVDSILKIVSEELDSDKPFIQNIVIGDPNGGQDVATLILNSGVYFSDNTFQNTAYPGPGSINHNDLSGLNIGDPHSIYLPSDGSRALTGSLEVQQWLNSDGTNGRGIKFIQDDNGDEGLNIADNTRLIFNVDNSEIKSAKGVALAWLNFSASGVGDGITVNSSYNIDSIERWKAQPSDPASEGKFRINFKEGTLNSANFIAIGSSNGRSDGDQASDFSINTVGLVERGGTGVVGDLHYVTFFVLSSDTLGGTGTPGYVDAPLNELVIYGLGAGVSSNENVQTIE
jgi:hypothetical protein